MNQRQKIFTVLGIMIIVATTMVNLFVVWDDLRQMGERYIVFVGVYAGLMMILLNIPQIKQEATTTVKNVAEGITAFTRKMSAGRKSAYSDEERLKIMLAYHNSDNKKSYLVMHGLSRQTISRWKDELIAKKMLSITDEEELSKVTIRDNP